MVRFLYRININNYSFYFLGIKRQEAHDDSLKIYLSEDLAPLSGKVKSMCHKRDQPGRRK